MIEAAKAVATSCPSATTTVGCRSGSRASTSTSSASTGCSARAVGRLTMSAGRQCELLAARTPSTLLSLAALARSPVLCRSVRSAFDVGRPTTPHQPEPTRQFRARLARACAHNASASRMSLTCDRRPYNGRTVSQSCSHDRCHRQSKGRSRQDDHCRQPRRGAGDAGAQDPPHRSRPAGQQQHLVPRSARRHARAPTTRSPTRTASSRTSSSRRRRSRTCSSRRRASGWPSSSRGWWGSWTRTSS